MVHELERKTDNKRNVSNIWHPRSNKDAQGLESDESQMFPPQKTLDSARVLTERHVIISIGIGRNSSLFKQEICKSFSQEAAGCHKL